MIERVYLQQDNQVELHFSNKLRRKFKDLPDFNHFIEPVDLKTPPTKGPNGEVGWAHRGDPFPTELAYKKDK